MGTGRAGNRMRLQDRVGVGVTSEVFRYWCAAMVIIADLILCVQVWRLGLRQVGAAISLTGIPAAAALLLGPAQGLGAALLVLHIAVAIASVHTVMVFVSGSKRLGESQPLPGLTGDGPEGP